MGIFDYAHQHVPIRLGKGVSTVDVIQGPLVCSICGALLECICADYDGKGWSTCGIPCPAHPPKTLIRPDRESGER